MKPNSFFLLFICSCITLSCAHKSGHQKKSSQAYAENSKLSHNDLTVKVSTKKGTLLDGPSIFDRYNSAVFMVYTSDGVKGYQGSGFFINEHGVAVSNYHVFQGTNKGNEQIKCIGSDNIYKVESVIADDEENDFIIFKVNCSNTKYIPIANSKPKVGEKVYAIGSPMGLTNTFSSGEISQWRGNNLMQISALIDHGSSGGALINEFGQVVGITSGSFADGSQANLNYAWSIDVIKPYIRIAE